MIAGSNQKRNTLGFLAGFRAWDNPEDKLQGQLAALKGTNGQQGAAAAAPQQSGQTAQAGAAAAAAGTVAGVSPLESTAKGATLMQPFAGGGDAQAGNTPAGNTPAGYDVERTKDLDDFHFNRDFLENYLEAPVSAEDRAKRERAAHAVAGIGHLGNILSAFSNLAFAGKAPSQKLPEGPDAGAEVRKEREYWDKQRNAYLNGKMQGRTMDLNEYKTYLSQKNTDRAYDLKEANIDLLTRGQDLKERVVEGKMSMDEAKLALQKRKLDIEEAYKSGMLSNAQYRAAIAAYSNDLKKLGLDLRERGSETTVTKTEEVPDKVYGGTKTKTTTTTTKKAPGGGGSVKKDVAGFGGNNGKKNVAGFGGK